jgi:arsenate reductase-like glutaredoxin family protein
MQSITTFINSDSPQTQEILHFFRNKDIHPEIIEVNKKGPEAKTYLLNQTGKEKLPTIIVENNGYRNYVFGLNLKRTEQLIDLGRENEKLNN